MKDSATEGENYPELPLIAAHLPNGRIDVQNYTVKVTVAAFPPGEIPLEVGIELKLNQTASFVDLHFERGSMTIDKIIVDDSDSEFSVLSGQPGSYGISGDVLRINLNGSRDRGDIVAIDISYRIAEISLNNDRGFHFVSDYYGTPILTSRNWPYYLRHWIPSNDHPADTASFQYIIDVPDGMVAAANGALLGGDYRNGSGLVNGLRRFEWNQPTPIPTYGANISIGNLEIVSDEICFSGENLDEQREQCNEDSTRIPFVYYLVRDHPSKQRFLELAEKGKDSLVFFHKLLGSYEYQKLGMVTAPHPFNMESVSMIVMVSPSATVHKVAHHWWGNTVYIEHWGDFWISEGFTTYFTGLYDQHFSGRNTACRSNSGVLANPFETDPMTIFDNTAYCKGAAAIMDLRDRMGQLIPEDRRRDLEQPVFYEAMRQVFQAFRFNRLGSFELTDYLKDHLAEVYQATGLTISQGAITEMMAKWRQQWLQGTPQ